MTTLATIQDTRRHNLELWFKRPDQRIRPKDKSYISQLLNGKTTFGERAARRLEEDYDMPEGALDVNHGEDSTGLSRSELDKLNQNYLTNSLEYSKVNKLLEIKYIKEVYNFLNNPNIRIYEQPNNSMSGYFNKDDLIIINRDISQYSGEGIYFIELNEEEYIRYFSKTPKGEMVMKSSDETFILDEETLKNMTFIGKVIKVIKVSVEDL
ncbi:S24 family peptidase [Actinobacillus minor]|uniref:S24 family peptidase n=1 Tax=Actinobacillus minor TaxID=51047 RepID=UPI0023F2982B|nr:S24 family peptidase [Actinobacillus minor]MDD6911279.1 S24 family peptidase [Actinobacillus minor]MDY4713248.1 S24 family peptidase [Actinobacillus minor]